MPANNESFIIKGYSLKELCTEYDATYKTFKKWLNLIPDLGDYTGKRFTPAQVEKIVKHIGKPIIN